jgi:phenylacetate-CoA ligase
MQVYPLDYIISYAREHSPYYRNLYAQFGEGEAPPLEQLPLVNQADFWSAAAEGKVATGAHIDGQVFKSGGTTGAPKYSMYSAAEWRTMCEATGFYAPMGGLRHGDRAVNLFYGGNLYASFLYTYSIFYFSPASVLQFNLSGSAEISEIADTIESNRVNIIAGLPSMLMKVIENIEERGNASNFCVDAVYFAGETLYDDQRRKIRAVLGEGVDFRSMSYASNDAGIMAYFHKGSCGFNEHRVCDAVCKLELIDPETGELIREAGRAGQIYVTSLYKLLMPIIRYPSGDMGKYTEPDGAPDRRFMLLGRSGEDAARVSYVSLYPEDVSKVLESLGADHDGFQMIVTHEGERDGVTFRIAGGEIPGFIEKLYEQRPFLKEAIDKGFVSVPKTEYCGLKDFEYNKRTGKLIRVLDKRIK